MAIKDPPLALNHDKVRAAVIAFFDSPWVWYAVCAGPVLLIQDWTKSVLGWVALSLGALGLAHGAVHAAREWRSAGSALHERP